MCRDVGMFQMAIYAEWTSNINAFHSPSPQSTQQVLMTVKCFALVDMRAAIASGGIRYPSRYTIIDFAVSSDVLSCYIDIFLKY